MTIPENPATPLTRICLLDFRYDDLRRILDDESLSKRLIEYDYSSSLSRIDELINLHEAPVTALLLNGKTVMDVRKEWSVEIPPDLAESIASFLKTRN